MRDVDAVRERDRLRAALLSSVSHDLRTPLNAISLTGRILEARVSGQGADSVKLLATLRRNVHHLERLVTKVLEENTNLETESGVKVERREFELWPLVEALIHDLHPVAGTDSTRLVNAVPDDLVVYADASLLQRVFQNLISNAIKYTPRGEVLIGALQTGTDGAVECWVTDNGAGIPDSLIEAIFEKGETDPELAGGTGLGLAIVKAFTEAHGGSVTVESQEGLGSTFRVTLPGLADRRAAGSLRATSATTLESQ